MKPETVLAIGAGYLLGRTKKMKLALTLAGLGAGKLASSDDGNGLLQQGTELLRSSPAFNDLIGDVRGQLVDAGKQAAASAARSQIDSLSERLLERRGAGRGEEEEEAGEEPEDAGEAEDMGELEDEAGPEDEREPEEERGDRRRAKSAAKKRHAKKQGARKQPAKKESARKRSPRERPAKKQAPSKRPAAKKSGQKSSAKKRPAKRPANKKSSGRSGSRNRSEKRSSSGSARRS